MKIRIFMTKKLIFGLILLLPAKTLSAGTALLWIPREHSQIDDVISRVEAGLDLKLTAALGEVPASLAQRIKDLEFQGRLELTARPAGDPLIPLFYYAGQDAVRWRNKPSSAAFTSDPFFFALRMSDARDAYTGIFRRPPASLACAPGAIVPEYIPLAKALGFKWLAAGPLVSTAPFSVIDAEGVTLVPFSPAQAGTARTEAAQFLVFDETLGLSGTDSRAALLAFLSAGSAPPYLTVSEALKSAVSTAMPAAQASQLTVPWSGDHTLWAGLPIQTGALTAFARTRSELMAHLNARQGDYKAAKAAFTEYFSVESGPKLLKLSDPDPEAARETEIEIQNALSNTYRLMDKVPPGWLFSTLSDIKEKAESAEKITVEKSSAAFTLYNNDIRTLMPVGGSSTQNERDLSTPAGAAKTDPYKLWKLARVGVSWTDGDIYFSFTPLNTSSDSSFNNSFAEPRPFEAPDKGSGAKEDGGAFGPAFSEARFDLYLDINNRPRAGSIRLLDGRAGRIFPDNAWEYALEVSPKAAALYAATTKGPGKIAALQTIFENGAFTVRVPRTALRGNPGLWSYAAFMLRTADDKIFLITDYLAEDFSSGYYYAVRPGKK
jgi:hypothetical protein